MSLPILQSLASKYDLDIDTIERYWKEEKENLDTDDLSDKDYKYIYETVKDRVMKKVRNRFDVNEDTNTDTAKCPDCGTEYLVNTGYCVVCDKKVAKPKSDSDTKKKEYYRSRKYEAKAETAKCPDCGNKYLVKTGYCVSCKKKVAEPKSEKKETKKERVRYTIPMNKRTRINRIVEGFKDNYAKRKVFVINHGDQGDWLYDEKITTVEDAIKAEVKAWGTWAKEGYTYEEALEYMEDIADIKVYTQKDIEEAVADGEDFPMELGIYIKEPDWKSLEKQLSNRINSFNVFDYGDTLGVEEVVDALKNGSWDDVYQRVEDRVFETAGVLVDELLEEEDFDINDVRENFESNLQELFWKAEELADYNIEDIMPNELFFYDVDAIEIPDYTSLYTEDGELVEEAEEFISKAKKFGFSEKDAVSVIENSSYGGGMGGVGIIVDGSDLAKAILNDNYKLTGDAILYIHDGYNGSGDYCIGKKLVTIDYKTNKIAYENMDYGKYSLGDVFGTTDWSY